MIRIQDVLGGLPILLGFITFVWYARNIVSGKLKPHAFSWLVWSVLLAIAFAAQVMKGAGPGAWFTAYGCLSSASVFFLSLKNGEKSITRSDWISLVVAGFSLVLWALSHDPTISIALVTLTDAVGYFPTLRKGYIFPKEESALVFATGMVQFLFSILALDTFSFVTAFYPAVCLVMNGIVVSLLLIRRGAIAA